MDIPAGTTGIRGVGTLEVGTMEGEVTLEVVTTEGADFMAETELLLPQPIGLVLDPDPDTATETTTVPGLRSAVVESVRTRQLLSVEEIQMIR